MTIYIWFMIEMATHIAHNKQKTIHTKPASNKAVSINLNVEYQ